MERLTLRDALASDRLEDFVRLANGSDLERALALLVTIRWSQNHRLGSQEHPILSRVEIAVTAKPWSDLLTCPQSHMRDGLPVAQLGATSSQVPSNGFSYLGAQVLRLLS